MRGGRRGARRVVAPELSVAHDVHDDAALRVLVRVERVEHVAGCDLVPPDVGVAAAARHHAEARAVVVTPPVRHAARERELDVEDERQVHEEAAFDSGVTALDDWLKQHALENEQSGGARTYVAHAQVGAWSVTTRWQPGASHGPRRPAASGATCRIRCR
jgi:hypothetical protein